MAVAPAPAGGTEPGLQGLSRRSSPQSELLARKLVPQLFWRQTLGYVVARARQRAPPVPEGRAMGRPEGLVADERLPQVPREPFPGSETQSKCLDDLAPQPVVG